MRKSYAREMSKELPLALAVRSETCGLRSKGRGGFGSGVLVSAERRLERRLLGDFRDLTPKLGAMFDAAGLRVERLRKELLLARGFIFVSRADRGLPLFLLVLFVYNSGESPDFGLAKGMCCMAKHVIAPSSSSMMTVLVL